MMSESGGAFTSEINLAATYFLAKWHPVYRQRDRASGSYVERENLSSRFILGTGAEQPVVVMKICESRFQRRGCVIQHYPHANHTWG
jgi:hypothetical protein